MLKGFFLSFVMILVAATSQAAVSELEKTILTAQQTCPRLNCPEASVQVIALTGSEQQELTKDVRAQMKAQVVELVENIWPDTILEGPYETYGRLRIDFLQKLVIDGAIVGYRISYSDKAWDLDTCEYDPNHPETLNGCATGRVFESAFFSKDLSILFRDEQAFATFIADANIKRNHL